MVLGLTEVVRSLAILRVGTQCRLFSVREVYVKVLGLAANLNVGETMARLLAVALFHDSAVLAGALHSASAAFHNI